MEMNVRLPPGQRARSDFPRFGLPAYARCPEIPSHRPLHLVGDIVEPCEITLEELTALPRQEQESDFHCVTTWSRCGLHWGGYRFCDFHERFVVPQVRPHAQARYLVFRGLDGQEATLLIEDALASDVLLADRLDGNDLPIEHGAPIRVVAPAHYGYKSVKHLSEIQVWRDLPGPLAWTEHLRARVAEEERGRLPGWLLRRFYRPQIGAVLWYYRRAARRTGTG